MKGFFEKRTSSIQYVVSCPTTKHCAIIDAVLDFNPKSGSIATRSADAILEYVRSEGLDVHWILDTHPHADHFSASSYIKTLTGAPTAIGARITEVQQLWQSIYVWPELATDGSQWDVLFGHGDQFKIGALDAQVLHSPGHTLASITYVIGDAAFVHDTLFMPDSGTARADFPGGSASHLWASIQKILTLPPRTRIFTGHDYQPGGREPMWESSIDAQRDMNIHLGQASDEKTFVELRNDRDGTLPIPELMLLALQVNINGGKLPEPGSDGRAFLRVPLGAFPKAVW